MAHFTAAGFTFQPSLGNSGLNKLKQSRPPEILLMHEGIQRWRGRGGREGSTLCWGDGGESPARSLSGVRTMLKPQMAACEDYANKAKGR